MPLVCNYPLCSSCQIPGKIREITAKINEQLPEIVDMKARRDMWDQCYEEMKERAKWEEVEEYNPIIKYADCTVSATTIILIRYTIEAL